MKTEDKQQRRIESDALYLRKLGHWTFGKHKQWIRRQTAAGKPVRVYAPYTKAVNDDVSPAAMHIAVETQTYVAITWSYRLGAYGIVARAETLPAVLALAELCNWEVRLERAD